MSPGKHGPATLRSYFNAHDGHMEHLVRSGIVVRDGLTIQPRGDSFLIAGDIEIDGGAIMRVRKLVRIVERSGSTTWVQTQEYTYNLHIRDLGPVFRYDGPDHHRDYHHVHRYDPFLTDAEAGLVELEWEHVPTLAEAIREAHDWCSRHRDALARRRQELGGG